MPTQERLRFDEQERTAPVLHVTREQNEPSAFPPCQLGTLHVTLQHDNLLPQEGIFEQQPGFTAGHIRHGADDHGWGTRCRPLFKRFEQQVNQAEQF
jgi:hypothetical protein